MVASPQELELRLLSSLTEADALWQCQELGITEESFTVSEYRKVYQFIQVYAKDNAGTMPSAGDIKVVYDVEIGESGDVAVLARQLRVEEIRQAANRILLDKVPLLDEAPVHTVQQLVTELSRLRTTERGRLKRLDADAHLWFDSYKEDLEKRGRGEFLGLPSGLRCIDQTGVGLLSGHLVCVLGSVHVGKSWLTLYMAAQAYAAGKRVLLVSPEMSTEEQGLRFQVLIAKALEQKFSHTSVFLREASVEQEYAALLAKLEQRSDFECVDASDADRDLFTFEGVADLAFERRPDVLVVDGLNLLGSRASKKSGWEVIKEGSALLKATAQQLNLVCITSHQADRSGVKNAVSPPMLDQVGYGLGIVQSVDVIISLSRSIASEEERCFRVIKLRGRKPINEVHYLVWLVDIGEIREKSPHEVNNFVVPAVD